MPHGLKVKPPKDDDGYFELMIKALFSAGLNWSMIEKKWPNFEKAFAGFSAARVAKFSESQVRSLMDDAGIVRNEKKIDATVYNAKEILATVKEFGSFKEYLVSFKKNEDGLQEDLQKRFRHLGPSSSRLFLWSAGYPLTPNAEEKMWLSREKS